MRNFIKNLARSGDVAKDYAYGLLGKGNGGRNVIVNAGMLSDDIGKRSLLQKPKDVAHCATAVPSIWEKEVLTQRLVATAF